jgi:threonine synthase
LYLQLSIDLAFAEEAAATATATAEATEQNADVAVNTSSGEPYKFQAEVSRILDIVVNSL